MSSSSPQNSGEPSGLLRTVVAFLSGALAWAFFSRTRSENIQKNINTIRQTGKAEHQQGHQQISINVTVRDTEEVIRERQSEADRQYRVQNGIRKATWAAFVAASVYGAIAFLQWRDSHNNFRMDERAWLNIEGKFPDTVQERDSIVSQVRMENTGKTPGKQIKAEYVVLVLKSTDPITFDYVDPRHSNDFVGILAPKEFSLSPVVEFDSELNVVSFTKNQAEDLMSGRSYLAVYGRGKYFDAFRDPHWFHFCKWKSYFKGASYNARSCVAYNDTGDGTGDVPEQFAPLKF
jgi:hypothetical protein